MALRHGSVVLLAFGTGLECLFTGLWDGGRSSPIIPGLSFISLSTFESRFV